MGLEQYGVTSLVVPRNGWHFIQEFKGTKQRIPAKGSAKGADELCEMVRLFRAFNNIELKDYRREVADHMKASSPQIDIWKGTKSSDDLVTPVKPKPPALIKRIADWLLQVSAKETRAADSDEVIERCKECSACRHNVAWADPKCVPCNQSVRDRGRALRGCVTHAQADQLFACRLHNLYLPSAVCLDRDNLPRKNSEAPDSCWLPTP